MSGKESTGRSVAPRVILSGIEVTHMIRNGQVKDAGIQRIAADHFYSLVI
ncbi:hypothetical protein [Paraburkholderia sp. WSM4174]|nr:hypothetical protein [Paraburkholderia sp. WSM4179]